MRIALIIEAILTDNKQEQSEVKKAENKKVKSENKMEEVKVEDFELSDYDKLIQNAIQLHYQEKDNEIDFIKFLEQEENI